MGSISTDQSGLQHHWMDKVREWKPKNPLPIRTIEPLAGQLELFPEPGAIAEAREKALLRHKSDAVPDQ